MQSTLTRNETSTPDAPPRPAGPREDLTARRTPDVDKPPDATNRSVLRRTVLPTFVVAGVLIAACLATVVLLDGRPAGWVLLGLGIVAAAGACFATWRNGRTFQRSFDDVARTVEAAAARLGHGSPVVNSAPRSMVEQLQGLVDGIDRVLDDRRQREREVMRADQLAMVGQVAAGVAHELRNPLTSVKMLVQTNLKEATRRGLPAEDLDVIEQEIRRMERCLQRFLDFARPPKPTRRPISLATLVGQTFALVDGRARRQHVTMTFVPPAIPVVAEADEDQIRQLIVNLVLNALDAMSDGGRIEVQLEADDAGQTELRVLDTGPGIPEELFPRLFDPFVSTKETGIGLGLAVSHRIAAGHGGSLTAVNRPEGGACFRLRLPASQLTTPST